MLVRPKITDKEIQQRRDKILEFFEKKPFSGKTAMYSAIPKYDITTELFNQLLDEKAIRFLHTRNGEKKYYVPRKWEIGYEMTTKSYRLLYYHCQEIMYQIQCFTEIHMEFQELGEVFCNLIENRYAICKAEVINMQIPNIKILEKDVSTLELFLFLRRHAIKLPRWKGLENIRGIIFENQTIEEFTGYISALADFTRFFLDHEARAYSLDKTDNYSTGKRQSVHRKLQMKFSNNNIEWKLKQKNFERAIEPITLGDHTNYEEVMMRLNAERQSIMTNNPEFGVYAHMFVMIYGEYNNLGIQQVGNIRGILKEWWEKILEIAAKKMENKTLGNDDTEVIIQFENQTLNYEIIDDMSKLDKAELERKKDIMSVILLQEF